MFVVKNDSVLQKSINYECNVGSPPKKFISICWYKFERKKDMYSNNTLRSSSTHERGFSL